MRKKEKMDEMRKRMVEVVGGTATESIKILALASG